MKEINDKNRLILPLWFRADEFEDFLMMWKWLFHVSDTIDYPEYQLDKIYAYEIKGSDIFVKCIFLMYIHSYLI